MPSQVEMRVAHYKDEQAPGITAVAISRPLPDLNDLQEVSEIFTIISQELFLGIKKYLKSTGEVELADFKSKGHTADIFALRRFLSLMEEGQLTGDVTVVQFNADHRAVIFDLRRPSSS